MLYNFPAFTIVFFIGGFLALFLAAITWMKRPAAGALPLAIFLLAAAEWTFANALEVGAVELADKVFWGKMMYFGLINTGILWIYFVVDFTGRNWWKKARYLLILYIIPVISLAVIWTNQWHGWFWSHISPSIETGGTILIYQHGFWFWVLWSYECGLMVFGLFVLSRFMIQRIGLYRKQLIGITISTVLPVIANLIYVLGLSPIQGLDLTSITFSISGMIYGFMLFHYRFLDVIPIARSSLVENMPDGLIVVNFDNAVMDINPAAAEMTGSPIPETIGKPLSQVWPDLGKTLSENNYAGNFEILLNDQDSLKYLDVRITSLQRRPGKVLGHLITLRDTTKRFQFENILKERAIVDELTGLYNHRHLHERLDEEISRCSRSGGVFSLLTLDLDLFKAYNDVYGHLEGDKILQQIGQRISNSIRGHDIGFRYGGDEFAAVLPGTNIADAFKVGERIRKYIDSQIDKKNIPLTCSIGVASWPANGITRIELLRSADTAMYHAKLTGRNRTCIASDLIRSPQKENFNASDSSKTILNTIYALAATVDAKDHHTYGHSKKVNQYATDIAESFGYSKERVDEIRGAALLHDIGKIGISDLIIKKPGRLTIEEWEIMKSHPDIGVSIVKHIEILNPCLAGIQHHHERYDGTGYPAGLKGDTIPLDARIIAVADAYDAMISSRSYRQGMTSLEALEEIKLYSGTQFDPEVVRVFLKIIERENASRAGLYEAIIS